VGIGGLTVLPGEDRSLLLAGLSELHSSGLRGC
jgi:hypothetical protein